MISILDYGVGNLTAFCTIYRRLNIPVEIATTVNQVLAADHLILPGVGSFDVAMAKLEQSGMRDALDRAVLDNRTPLLGVCVGMQMLANLSAEGHRSGLGYIAGEVCPLSDLLDPDEYSLPHMGWNNVSPTEEHSVWENVDHRLGFYFLHSYFFLQRLTSTFLPEHNMENHFPVQFKGGMYLDFSSIRRRVFPMGLPS